MMIRISLVFLFSIGSLLADPPVWEDLPINEEIDEDCLDIECNEYNSYSLDLTQYVVDSDDDEIFFSVDPEFIEGEYSATIDEGILQIIPSNHYYGLISLVLTASDLENEVDADSEGRDQ